MTGLRRRAAATLLVASGGFMYVLGALLATGAVASIGPLAGQLRGMEIVVAILIVVAVVGIAFVCIRGGKALRRAGLRMRLQTTVVGTAPLVVYLRAFSTDVAGNTAPTVSTGNVAVEGLSTHEEHLAAAFRDAGELVAISAPSLKEHPLGAVRIAAEDEVWQRKVRELLVRARLVVLRCGTTPGIVWELRQVLSHCAPERVVLLLHAGNDEARQEHALLSKLLPQPPPVIGGIWSEHEGLAGICIFNAAWQPRLRLFRRAGTRASIAAPIVAPLRFALEPVFARIGIPWKKPPLPLRLKIFGAIMAMPAAMGTLAALSHPEGVMQIVLGGVVLLMGGIVAAVLRLNVIRGPHVIERIAGASAEPHPLHAVPRGVLRIVNRCLLQAHTKVMIIADGHRIAEFTAEEPEIAVDIAEGRHTITACFSARPDAQTGPLICDIRASGTTTVLCSTRFWAWRPASHLRLRPA